MAALIDAIDVKRKMFVEFENVPFHCLEAEISTPTARGGQTLVRLKMRNMLTRAVFDKTFKASDKFKEPDLQTVEASYLYSDADGSYFLDQETFETLTLSEQMVGDALELLVEGVIIHIDKYNGNPIGLQLPAQVELAVTYTEPGVRGDTASGSVTKPAKLETGIEIRVPCLLKKERRSGWIQKHGNLPGELDRARLNSPTITRTICVRRSLFTLTSLFERPVTICGQSQPVTKSTPAR